ncbi:MAG: DUF885 family protein [Parvularculaceae bacterium]
MTKTNRLFACAAAGALLAACGGGNDNAANNAPETAAASVDAPTSVGPQDQTAAINAWFEEQWEARVARSPQWQTFLGRKTNYDKWDDASDAYAIEGHELQMAAREEMRERFDVAALDPTAALSYRLYDYDADEAQKFFPYRNHWYRFSHFRGPHSGVPAFLINQHRVDDESDAEAYIRRLEGVEAYLGQNQKVAENQFADGVNPPKWSYPQMIATARNVINGAPFDEGAPSTLLADFTKKVGALEIEQDARDALVARAEAAMLSSVKPAYEALIAMFEAQAADASADDGAWKLPDGEAYYAVQLERFTTTSKSADEIHDLGLSEVARIHEEMTAIKDAVSFDGSLGEFFVYMREDPDGKFSYPNTDEGRTKYLAEATALIDTMRGRLDELFYTKPEAALTVKRVAPFREKSAGKAFYQRPAPNGSRPGIYYANLYDMGAMPIYQMVALAYHEGIPGHHMQIAIAQELEGLPSFRRFGGVTAFSEGWGLYSEYIPKEMGFYEDPYSDFGRLAMELWRAARLVVDTGLHSKRWTRQQAIDYLIENTPNPALDCERAIERYVVMPGQATAYKIGMLKILELRARAEEALGEKFDVRGFHDAVLGGGAVPLAVLEENVDDWIASRQAA